VVDGVLKEVACLRRDLPDVLVVLVTREPRRFTEAFVGDDRVPVPIVVPKPVWGWIILDAIRGHLDRA
jgi:hypothetical protein